MGLFDIFKRKPRFADDLFGELVYSTFSHQADNFFEGCVKFHSQEIGVTIDADEFGPTQKQKDFYITLRDNYPKIKDDIIIPYLHKELIVWLNKEPIVEFDTEFIIDGISLPDITDQPIAWSMTFYCIKIDHYLTIEFIDLSPKEGVIVDG